jgi:hypothetical protein
LAALAVRRDQERDERFEGGDELVELGRLQASRLRPA